MSKKKKKKYSKKQQHDEKYSFHYYFRALFKTIQIEKIQNSTIRLICLEKQYL